eukprot:879531-Rhodomonas_salina.1
MLTCAACNASASTCAGCAAIYSVGRVFGGSADIYGCGVPNPSSFLPPSSLPFPLPSPSLFPPPLSPSILFLFPPPSSFYVPSPSPSPSSPLLSSSFSRPE